MRFIVIKLGRNLACLVFFEHHVPNVVIEELVLKFDQLHPAIKHAKVELMHVAQLVPGELNLTLLPEQTMHILLRKLDKTSWQVS